MNQVSIIIGKLSQFQDDQTIISKIKDHSHLMVLLINQSVDVHSLFECLHNGAFRVSEHDRELHSRHNRIEVVREFLQLFAVH